MANTRGKSGSSNRFYFLGLQNDCRWWLKPWNKRCLLLGRKVMTNIDSVLKNRDITLPTKVQIVKTMVFPVVMYGRELDHKEGWAPKNWCFWTVGLEKTLESPLTCKEIKPVNPKGNQPWIFIGRTDAEGPILWPRNVKSRLIGKDPDAGRDWRQEEEGVKEDKMVRSSITDSTNVNLSKLRDTEESGAWDAVVHGVPKSRTRFRDWITTATKPNCEI